MKRTLCCASYSSCATSDRHRAFCCQTSARQSCAVSEPCQRSATQHQSCDVGRCASIASHQTDTYNQKSVRTTSMPPVPASPVWLAVTPASCGCSCPSSPLSLETWASRLATCDCLFEWVRRAACRLAMTARLRPPAPPAPVPPCCALPAGSDDPPASAPLCGSCWQRRLPRTSCNTSMQTGWRCKIMSNCIDAMAACRAGQG